MPHESFNPSNLDKKANFRKQLWEKGTATDHMDRYQKVLSSALKEVGDTEVTRDNIKKVMEHVHKDSGYHSLYSAGAELDAHLRQHLGIKEEESAH